MLEAELSAVLHGRIAALGESNTNPTPESEMAAVSSQAVPSAHIRKEKHACRPDQTPAWKISLEGGAIFIAVCVAVIYGGQLWVMKGQLDQMQGSSTQTDKLICIYQQQLAQLTKQADDTHDLAIATRNQAEAAKTSTKTAQSSLQATIDNFHEDQRAWVGVFAVNHRNEGRPAAKSSMEDIQINILNTGRTPTREARITMTSCMQYGRYIPSDSDKSWFEKILSTTPPEPFIASQGSLDIDFLLHRSPLGYCQDVADFQVGGLSPGNPRTISIPRGLDTTSGVARTISVFGRMRYRDVFTDKERDTTFCDFTFKFGEIDFSQCPTYNDMN